MLIDSVLPKFSLFQNIQAQSLAAITRSSKLNYLKKGTIFYNAKENAKSYFYFIAKGWVKLFTVSLAGQEIIRDILNDTHYFNEGLLFRNQSEPICAQAISELQLIAIPIILLRQCLAQDQQLAINLLRESLQKQCELNQTVEHLAIQNAAQRIGCFLLRLCPAEKTVEYSLHLPYDKILVAHRLGMCAETFSRALVKLCKSCCIQVAGDIIHIPQLSLLSNYVCKQCSLRYPCHTN